MKKSTYSYLLLLINVTIMTSCDQVNSDLEAPVLTVDPVQYFRENTAAYIAVYDNFKDLGTVRLESSNPNLEIVAGLEIENGVWLKYSPTEAYAETVDFSFYDGDKLVGSAAVEMNKYNESQCIRSSFAEKMSYSHADYENEADKTQSLNIMTNDALCSIDWESSEIFVWARGNSLGSDLQDDFNKRLFRISPGSATFNVEPKLHFRGEVSIYYTLAVLPSENIQAVFPEKNLSECQSWVECLTKDERVVFVERILNDYRGEFTSLYSNASVDLTVTD